MLPQIRLLRRNDTPAPRPRRRPASRPPSYYRVAGIDLAAELERLCRLEELGGPGGRLATGPPELAIRRASKRPRSRLGYAVPDENRISVTAYPAIRRGDVLETLLHELVHIAVGPATEGRRWHGREFTTTLRAAMAEAYGISGVGARSSYHGVYAEAIEARIAAPGRQQAPLPLAASG
jgi:hypothetical protein